MMNLEPKYKQNQWVECISRTQENHEKLVLGDVYQIIGANEFEGHIVYAVKDKAGHIIYSIDRFMPVEAKKEEPKEELVVVNEEIVEDVVNAPSHYLFGGIQPLDYMKAKMSHEAYMGYLQGNVFKYVSRAGKKDDVVQDLKKAQFYLNRLVATMEEGTEEQEASQRPITKEQIGYIAGLTTQLEYDRYDLPKHISPLPNYKELTEAEGSAVIDRLLAIKSYLEDFRG